MKNSGIVFSCILLAGILCAKPAAAQSSSGAKTAEGPAANSQNAAAPEFKDDKEKISYALGMRMALQLKVLRKSVDVDPEMVAQGLKDSLSGGKTRLTDEERLAVLTKLQKDIELREQVVKQQMAETNLNEGQAFLAANKSKEGVVTLPSGLQYKVLKQGAGPKPTWNDIVVCNYRGTLIDGTEFDSSYKRGQPSTFRVIGVIPGWSEALLLMPVGSKWQLFIPSKLAYGGDGHGNIEPNATLIFEVELLSIQDQGQNKDKDKARQDAPAK